MPEAIAQLGIAVTVMFIVWQIIRAVLTNVGDNDKNNTDITKSLITMMTGLSSAINNNSAVLTELKEFISSERSGTKDAIRILKEEILARFGTTDRKIDLVIKMLDSYQQSLEDTIPAQEKDDGDTRL